MLIGDLSGKVGQGVVGGDQTPYGMTPAGKKSPAPAPSGAQPPPPPPYSPPSGKPGGGGNDILTPGTLWTAKSAARGADTVRMDAGTGNVYSGSQMDRMHHQITQAAVALERKYGGGTPTVVVQPVVQPQTYVPGAGGGGGGGGYAGGDEMPAGFWASLSTPAKVGIVAGGVGVVGLLGYLMMKKGGGGDHRSKSYSS